MTTPNDHSAIPEFAATDEEGCAAEWVTDRRNQKGWTDEHQAQLDAWLAKSIANRIAYIRIEAAWRRTDRLAALREPIKEPVNYGPSFRTRWMHIAGALCLTAILGAVVNNYLRQPRPELIQTPKGGQERLTLSDGSQIELNTDSAVLIDIRDRSRAVEFVRGEALFQIRHDALRPFIVTVGRRRIVDLGTKFLVRRTPGMTKVALIEGSARLEDASSEDDQHAVVLVPGEVAMATTNAVRVSKHTSRELWESLAWQHGAVVFRGVRLADAVAELNRYGGPQLVVADGDTAKLAVTGTFLTGNAEEFAGITHELFGVRVKRQGGSIILSR